MPSVILHPPGTPFPGVEGGGDKRPMGGWDEHVIGQRGVGYVDDKITVYELLNNTCYQTGLCRGSLKINP